MLYFMFYRKKWAFFVFKFQLQQQQQQKITYFYILVILIKENFQVIKNVDGT